MHVNLQFKSACFFCSCQKVVKGKNIFLKLIMLIYIKFYQNELYNIFMMIIKVIYAIKKVRKTNFYSQCRNGKCIVPGSKDFEPFRKAIKTKQVHLRNIFYRNGSTRFLNSNELGNIDRCSQSIGVGSWPGRRRGPGLACSIQARRRSVRRRSSGTFRCV